MFVPGLGVTVQILECSGLDESDKSVVGAYFSTFVTFGFLGPLCDRPDAQTVLRSSLRETAQKGDGLQLPAPWELQGELCRAE